MLHFRYRRAAVSALAALVLSSGSVWAWPLGAPLYSSRYPVAPSYYGYPLTDTAPTYFGGINYREYYSYGRGYGIADYPGPVPNVLTFGKPKNFRGYPLSAPPDGPMPMLQPVPQVDPLAHLLVHVPAQADIWLEGERMQQPGPDRRFVTPPLEIGEKYSYEVRARWTEDGKEIEQSKNVILRSGDWISIRFPTGGENELLPKPRSMPVTTSP